MQLLKTLFYKLYINILYMKALEETEVTITIPKKGQRAIFIDPVL